MAEALEPARRAEIDDFLSSGGLPPIGAAARTHALARLIDSDIPVASASAAISQLDEVLAGLGQLRTADDAIAGIDARLAQLADNSRADFDAAAQNPWCLVQLILSSLFATMLLVFTILCLLALCDPVTVFEQWVQQVCGVT